MTSQLQQFNAGPNRNFGFIAGPKGFIVTENDFCHHVYRNDQEAELNTADAFKPPVYVGFSRVAIESMVRPIESYRQWAHYWGIKSRIAANYYEFWRSMKAIGLTTDHMPKFGEEPVTSTAASAGTA